MNQFGWNPIKWLSIYVNIFRVAMARIFHSNFLTSASGSWWNYIVIKWPFICLFSKNVVGLIHSKFGFYLYEAINGSFGSCSLFSLFLYSSWWILQSNYSFSLHFFKKRYMFVVYHIKSYQLLLSYCFVKFGPWEVDKQRSN